MSYITQTKLADSFRAAGIKPGDVLMLHADAIVLAQLPPMPAEQRFQCLFDALDSVLGPDGTLVMPTFTYSFTKGEIFDPRVTPGTVGALSEFFRKLPGVVRSADPIFSVAARGRLAHEFENSSVDDSFGPFSAFALLEKHNAYLACLGCSFKLTYTHYLEQKMSVDYRIFKTFSGILVRQGQALPLQTRYFVRDLDRRTDIDLALLQARLKELDLLAIVPVGRVALYAVSCHSFGEQAQQLVAEQPNALIDEGRKHHHGATLTEINR